MKAVEANMLAFLKKSPQFVIPIYQRAYSWTAKECGQLWNDVIRAGSDDGVAAHFVGSIVYIEKGLYQISSHTPLLVIDGQQRLTTVTLLIAALAEALEALPEPEQEPIDGFSPRRLRNYYLLNPEEEGERHFKLVLSQNDRNTLTAVVAKRELPASPSIRVADNYEQFRALIKSLDGDLNPLCRGLAKLLVVDVALTRGQDNPQLIFESMNSTGKELSQADLIRNYVLMGLEPELQSKLYEDYWRPMEIAFGQQAYVTHFDSFMRDYLTVKTGSIPNVRAVYDEFKKFAGSPAPKRVAEVVPEIREFARYYCAIALDQEADSDLCDAFSDLRELKVDVAYPFLMELYRDFKSNALSKPDFVEILRLVEAYVFRRAVSAMPTNSMNKTFATFSKSIQRDRYVESVSAHFQTMPTYRRFPTDEEFARDLLTRDLYNFGARRSYWLRRLENFGRKERVSLALYTIEHILPQNESLSAAWRSALGPDWSTIQKTWLHTIGNLTLTGYNSEYSDRPFAEKRDMDGGFKTSPLILNAGLGAVEQWNEGAIRARAERLIVQALKVWPGPKLDAATLASYSTKPTNQQVRLEDHAPLAGGPIRELFDSLRREIVAIDASVTEEVYRSYVAFKAETNFVDIVPQQQRLRLILNMSFEEIRDPKGLCRDVTNVGHLGNGDVEVLLTSAVDLPYVMSLVRQSFERQMVSEPGE